MQILNNDNSRVWKALLLEILMVQVRSLYKNQNFTTHFDCLKLTTTKENHYC